MVVTKTWREQRMWQNLSRCTPYFGGAVWVIGKVCLCTRWENTTAQRGLKLWDTILSHPSPHPTSKRGFLRLWLSTFGGYVQSDKILPASSCALLHRNFPVLPLYNQDNDTYSSDYSSATLNIKCAKYYTNIIMIGDKTQLMSWNLQCHLGYMTGKYINQPEKAILPLDTPCEALHSEFCTY